MFGIPDPGIYLAYIFTIGSLVLCVVYGLVNWNKGHITEEPPEEAQQWEKEEEEINENL